jgi:hypothetical protein
MRMGGDYFVSQKIPTGSFNSSILNKIIRRYPLSSPHFLPESKTLHHISVFLGRVLGGIE